MLNLLPVLFELEGWTVAGSVTRDAFRLLNLWQTEFFRLPGVILARSMARLTPNLSEPWSLSEFEALR